MPNKIIIKNKQFDDGTIISFLSFEIRNIIYIVMIALECRVDSKCFCTYELNEALQASIN